MTRAVYLREPASAMNAMHWWFPVGVRDIRERPMLWILSGEPPRRFLLGACAPCFVAPQGASVEGGEFFTGMALLPLPELLVLLRGAAVVLTNGGDTLIQAIAVGIPSVAVPIAADQPGRIARCVQAGVARESKLDAAAMSAAVLDLLDRPGAAEELRDRCRHLALRDGLRESVDALAAMLPQVEQRPLA